MEVTTNSSNLTIRPFKLSDADDFLIYVGDDKVTRFSLTHTIKTKQEALSFIEQNCISHPYYRSICLNDRSIGFVYVKPGSGLDQCRAGVGYMLAAKYWGQGIVAKALKIAIVEAFKEFPWVVRMQALVESENEASAKVLEKVGFTREGRILVVNEGKMKVEAAEIEGSTGGWYVAAFTDGSASKDHD